MESVTPKVRYTFYTNVQRIEHRTRKRYVSGVGDKARFVDEDLGYWLHLEGSYEALFLGLEEPTIHTHDLIKVTFEKAHSNAHARQASVERVHEAID